MPNASAPPHAPSPHASAPAAPNAGYRGLRVWQRALDLTVDTATLARALELDGFGPLAADLFRAGLAVPAHVAAGSVAATRAEHQRAVGAALAAVARFETLLAATERLAPGAGAMCATLLAGTADVTRSLRAFARAIGGTPSATRRPAAFPAPDGQAPPDHAAGSAADTRADAVADAVADAATAPPTPESVPPPMTTRPARARRTGRTPRGE